MASLFSCPVKPSALNQKSVSFQEMKQSQSIMVKTHPTLLFSAAPQGNTIRKVVIPENIEVQPTATGFKALLESIPSQAVISRQDALAFYEKLQALTAEFGEKLGFANKKETPRMVLADAYTAASEGFIHQDAKDFSSYHIAFRREQTPWMKEMGLKPEDSRFVFFGLQQIMAELLQNPVTQKEIDEAEKFFQTAKGNKPFKWNKQVWQRVVDECHGKIPIKIEALPDGSVTFPGEPIIQVSAKDGFGELSAWFETKMLQVWATSERASLMRHWLEYNKDLVRQCTNEPLTEEQVTAKAQSLLVDFSDRSSMNAQESELLGLASLTSITTTSTLSAAYRAYKESKDNPVAKASMYSLAHRVVQSYVKEKDAYLALFDFSKGEIASYVADCYDFRRAVKNDLLPLALKAKETGGIICARPDSGDPYEEILFVLKTADEAGLSKTVIS
ncbi:MAG: nicotinamide phosphoribosyltransferase domain-containing protein, partial [Cyanobacteria bacterium]|nr:nicotinamide phosphoribosyltransferase domain-containing protein [Cyanobacteriota bacterium]